eukprot:gene16915-12412_t
MLDFHMDMSWQSLAKEIAIAIAVTFATFLIGLCVGVPVAKAIGRLNGERSTGRGSIPFNHEKEQLRKAEESHDFISRRGKWTKAQIANEKRAWKEKEKQRLAQLAEERAARKAGKAS